MSAARTTAFACPIMVGLVLLAGCNHAAARYRARMTNARAAESASPGQSDSGALLLAGAENARFAIARGDQVAAANDVAQALSESQFLAVEPSGVIASEVGDAAGRMGPFQAQVRLLSAQADLLNGDLAKADATLSTIERGVPAGSIPIDLALVRARESLDLAVGAASTGRPSDVTTHLMSAEAALNAYAGQPHAAEARALAAAIDQDLTPAGHPSPITADRLSLLAEHAAGWLN
jgi:hypothetical protein